MVKRRLLTMIILNRCCTSIDGGGTGGGGAGGPVAPPLFRLGGMAPPLFCPSCCKVKKNRPNRHAVKCLTWKIVHQIASFKLTFSKKLQLLRGHIPPHTPPCVAQARRPALTRHVLLESKNFGPPPPLWKSLRHLWTRPILCGIAVCVVKH